MSSRPTRGAAIRARLSSHEVALTVFGIALAITIIGAAVWCGILTPTISRAKNNTHRISRLKKLIEELNITVEDLLDDFNASQQAIAAMVHRSEATETVLSTENFPFDNVTYDPFDWWNATELYFAVDRAGLFEIIACVTVDQENTDGFPTDLVVDEQLQIYVNDVFAPHNGLLAINTRAGLNVSFVDAVCGSAVYLLAEDDQVALRLQVEIQPATILNATVLGGTAVATRMSLEYLGQT